MQKFTTHLWTAPATWLFSLVVLLFFLPEARANPVVFQIFRVPSGIHLGQPAQEVRNVLEREKATFVNQEETPQGDVWTVEDLFIRNFHSGEFRFEDGKLTEIEFRYGDEDWSTQKLRRLMYDYKILLEHKLGFADDHHKESSTMGPITESTEAYTWLTQGGNVQLVLFTASQEGNSYRVFSAHIGHDLGAPGRSGSSTADAPLPDVEDVGDGVMLFVDDPDLPQAAEKVEMPDEPLPAELFSTPEIPLAEEPAETTPAEPESSEIAAEDADAAPEESDTAMEDAGAAPEAGDPDKREPSEPEQPQSEEQGTEIADDTDNEVLSEETQALEIPSTDSVDPEPTPPAEPAVEENP